MTVNVAIPTNIKFCLLYSACNGLIKIPGIEMNVVIHEPQHAFLDLNKFHDVYIYSVHSPNLFFVQRTDFLECMDTISDKLNKMIKRGTLKKPKRIEKNMICAAPFSDENSWFRASINYVNIDTGEVCLFFVDYGDTNTAKIKDIYCIPPELLLLPFQAIECSLAGVSPCKYSWTFEVTELLHRLTSTESMMTKMVVKALKTESSRFRRGKRYLVQLWDMTLDHNIYVADELVKQGVALPCSLPEVSEKLSPAIDEPLPGEECERSFFLAIAYGTISEEIDKLVAKRNSEMKEKSNDVEKDLFSVDQARSKKAINYNNTKYFIPKVQWCQTDKTVSIQISEPNPTKYEVKISGLHVSFVAILDDAIYRLEEDLFGIVHSETYDVKANGKATLFTFVKYEVGKWWPQLTKIVDEDFAILRLSDEDQDVICSMVTPIAHCNPENIFPYDPSDEYEKENLSDDDVPWEQVCLPLDIYDMLCWD